MADKNLNPAQLKEILGLLKQIKKGYDSLKEDIPNPFKDIDASNVEKTVKDLGGATKVLKQWTLELDKIDDKLDEAGKNAKGLFSTFTNILAEVKNNNEQLNIGKKSIAAFQSIAEKLRDDQLGITELGYKDLQNLKAKGEKAKANLTSSTKELKLQIEKGVLNKEQIAAAKTLIAENEKEAVAVQDTLNLTEQRLETEKSIQKTLGITGGLFKGIAKSLEHIGIESEHFEKINEDLREAAKTGSGLNVVAAGFKGIAKGIGSALADPAVQLGVAGGILHTMVEAGMEFSHETSQIQKNLGLSKTAAAEMNTELEHMAVHSEGVLMNHSDLVKANSELNASLGTSVIYSAKQLQDNIKLKEVAGLEADEREGILKFSMLTGKSQEVIYDSIGKQNKGALSNKKVLSEVLKTSGQLSAQYKNNPDLLAKAVTQAQKLGMTLEQTKNISKGLLNFEDSIAAEMEAELLTGQSLNLEQARYLALQGDSAGAAAELMKNLGPNGLSKFQSMNIVQQEAYAKALNMSTDELADSLVKQKQLESIGKEESAALKKRVAELKASGEMEKAAELEKQALAGKSVALAEQELGTKEKLDKSMASIKSSFTSMVAGPMAKTLELFSGLLEKIAGNPVGKMIIGFAGGAAALGALILGTVAAVKTVKSLLGRGPADRTAKATESIDRKIGRGGSMGADGGGTPGRRGKKGKKGKFGSIASMAMTGLGMASMLGGGEEMSGEDMASTGMDIADVASDMGSSQASKATKTASTAAKGGGFLSKAGSFFGGIGKKMGGGLGSIKKLFQGPIAKGFSRILGPAVALIESISSASSLISDAREKKSAGEKIDTGSLGKSLVQAAAYPIANLATNLIPGVGQAVSIADATLGAFGMSPIKWLSDNLIDLIPNDAFSGLGGLAVGEKAMATGGIVNGPTRALIGEAGAEAVIPLDKFYAKFDELISVVKAGGHVYIDGNKVGQSLVLTNSKLG
jgi:hypothetical protein